MPAQVHSSHRQSAPPASSIRSAAYRLPDPLRSESDWRRFHHVDLETMSGEELAAEREAARAALHELLRSGRSLHLRSGLWSIDAACWLRERLRATSEGGR